MKYINKQKHPNTCGAVALANVVKKLGGKMSYEKALKLCGGYKKFQRNRKKKHSGMYIPELMKVLKKLKLDATRCRISLKEAKYFSSFDEYAVVACVVYTHKKLHWGHFVVFDNNGQGLNIGNKKNITQKEWKATKKHWGHIPTCIIVRRKK